MKELRRVFLVGIFAVAPLGLTVYLLLKLFGWFDNLFQPLIQPIWLQFSPHPIPGLGVVVGIVFVFFVGLIAPSLVGKQLLFLADKALERLPVAKWIYSGTRQIFDSFSQSNITKFNRVVLVKFPHQDSLSLGFVTQEVDNLPTADGKHEHRIVVFVPTTPNPTSGYLMFVEEKDSIPVDMTVDEALKFVISIGLVKPIGLRSTLAAASLKLPLK